eukprot:scaffold121382_cov18-Tisochrysis_lutea.AAC.1
MKSVDQQAPDQQACRSTHVTTHNRLDAVSGNGLQDSSTTLAHVEEGANIVTCQPAKFTQVSSLFSWACSSVPAHLMAAAKFRNLVRYCRRCVTFTLKPSHSPPLLVNSNHVFGADIKGNGTEETSMASAPE